MHMTEFEKKALKLQKEYLNSKDRFLVLKISIIEQILTAYRQNRQMIPSHLAIQYDCSNLPLHEYLLIDATREVLQLFSIQMYVSGADFSNPVCTTIYFTKYTFST